MRTIDDLLGEVPALRGLSAEHREIIAGCARNETFHEGDRLLREGEPADVFYVIREGQATIETFGAQRGALTLQTLQGGDLLGWSWLVPPYRVTFEARALTTTHAIAFDAACLREKCDRDPALGYALLKLFAGVIVQRLQNTRLQLLDLYGANGS